MVRQIINVGAQGNDGTGDPSRVAGQKINENFAELYEQVAEIATSRGVGLRVLRLDDVSAGFDGVATSFPLRLGGAELPPADQRFFQVTLNGLVQHPSAWSVTGTEAFSLVFTQAPRAGWSASVVYFEIIEAFGGSTDGGGGGGGDGGGDGGGGDGGGGDGSLCISVFSQATEPGSDANPCAGAVWFNTADGKIYRWSGTAWVLFTPDTPDPIEIVDALPTTGNFEGRIVLLRTDWQLYVYRDGAWALLVPPVSEQSIIDGLYTNGLRPVELVNALPTTGNVEGRVVYLSTDGKLYIYRSGGWVSFNDYLTPNAPVGIEVFSANPTTGNYEGRVIFNTTLNQLLKFVSGAWVQVVEPISAAEDVADGSITTAKFASGITPVELVSALPTTANFEGRIVYLTTDDKLYRYTGTAWTSATAAADITGELASTQIGANAITSGAIAANAITADKLAAGSVTAGKVAAGAISASEIASGAITTAKLAAGAITAEKIAALAITAEKVAASAITADALAANAVTAGKIQAGAVGATQIAASAITGDKIAANTITGGSIQAGTIAASNIASAAITAAKIAAGAVTSEKIATNAVVAGTVAAGAIGASQIQAGSISATQIASNSITADKIVTSSLVLGTLNLTEESVTATRTVQAANLHAAVNTFHTLASLSFPCTAGSRRTIIATTGATDESANNVANTDGVGFTTQCRILVNGVEIPYVPDSATAGGTTSQVSFFFLDTTSRSGTVTFTFQGRALPAAGSTKTNTGYRTPTLVVLEHRR